jgi:hypothetical protein
MTNKKETRGGTRQGSGAKPKYNEETKKQLLFAVHCQKLMN